MWLCTCLNISESQAFWLFWEKARGGQNCHERMWSVLVWCGDMLRSVTDCSTSPSLRVTQQGTEEKYPAQCQVSVSCCTSALILFSLTKHCARLVPRTGVQHGAVLLFWSTQTDTRNRFMFWRERKVKFVHVLVPQHTHTHTLEVIAHVRQAKREL